MGHFVRLAAVFHTPVSPQALRGGSFLSRSRDSGLVQIPGKTGSGSAHRYRPFSFFITKLNVFCSLYQAKQPDSRGGEHLDNNWIVENLTNAFATWNSKMAELWSLLTESPQTFKGGTIW